MRTIASKFPRYSFEELLDKTPAWINWTLIQAIKLGSSNGGLSGEISPPPPKPMTWAEETQALRNFGFKIRRE